MIRQAKVDSASRNVRNDAGESVSRGYHIREHDDLRKRTLRIGAGNYVILVTSADEVYQVQNTEIWVFPNSIIDEAFTSGVMVNHGIFPSIFDGIDGTHELRAPEMLAIENIARLQSDLITYIQEEALINQLVTHARLAENFSVLSNSELNQFHQDAMDRLAKLLGDN